MNHAVVKKKRKPIKWNRLLFLWKDISSVFANDTSKGPKCFSTRYAIVFTEFFAGVVFDTWSGFLLGNLEIDSLFPCAFAVCWFLAITATTMIFAIAINFFIVFKCAHVPSQLIELMIEIQVQGTSLEGIGGQAVVILFAIWRNE
jgi:hypothetical protein